MDEKISVIMPVYNGERFIASALDSVLNQTFPAREIIVVDDGSSDSTPAILRSYGKRITVIRINNSGGCSVPRNTGIRAATGTHIALIDADDVWARGKLAFQVETLRKFPGVRFVCADFFIHSPLGALIRHFNRERFKRELKDRSISFDEPFDAFPLLVNRNFVGCPSMVMFEKSLFDEVGPFDPFFNAVEDFEYWVRCSEKTPFLIISRPLGFKRTHDSNVSLNQVMIIEKHKQVIANLLADRAGRLNTRRLRHACRHTIARLDLALAWTLKRRMWKKKVMLYLQSLYYDPRPVNLKRIVMMKTVKHI